MNGMYGNAPAPEDQKLCVLYDPSNGNILHTHWVTTLPGGRKVDKAELEKRIRERATSRGRDASGLKVLHVDPAEYVQGIHYRVDLAAGKLAECPKQNNITRPTA
jgi:hypothetical protein